MSCDTEKMFILENKVYFTNSTQIVINVLMFVVIKGSSPNYFSSHPPKNCASYFPTHQLTQTFKFFKPYKPGNEFN